MFSFREICARQSCSQGQESYSLLLRGKVCCSGDAIHSVPERSLRGRKRTDFSSRLNIPDQASRVRDGGAGVEVILVSNVSLSVVRRYV